MLAWRLSAIAATRKHAGPHGLEALAREALEAPLQGGSATRMPPAAGGAPKLEMCRPDLVIAFR
jgi:hypothetical protein